MNIDDYIAVSGKPGLYRLTANRTNGLILEDIDSGKSRFFSAMRNQFTPLNSISIYTTRDTMSLENVLRNMLQQYEDNPPVNPNSSSEELEDYFMDILPDYDTDKVFTGDIKKIIKWFNYLNDRDLLTLDEDPLAGDLSEEEE